MYADKYGDFKFRTSCYAQRLELLAAYNTKQAQPHARQITHKPKRLTTGLHNLSSKGNTLCLEQ